MNEIINILLHLVSVCFTILFSDLCYAVITRNKLDINKNNLIIILIASILVVLNNIYLNMELKAILTIAIMIGNIKLIFDNTYKNAFIVYLIIYMIMILFELLFTNIISTLNLFSLSAFSLTYAKLGLSIIIAIVEYLIIKIPFIKKILIKLVKLLSSITTLMNVLYLLIFSLVTIGIFNVYNYESKGSFKIILLIVFLFAILFIYLISTIANSHLLKMTNKKLIDYNHKYGKFLDEYKIYKHNINHKLSAMKSFGNKKINALIDDLLEEETTFSIRNNEIYNVPNGIKGIVAEKLYNKNYDVIINNDIKNDPFDKLDAKTFHSLYESLGIVLDNAIEASEETKSPIIVMDLYEDESSIFVKVGNNFCNEIDLDKLGEKYYSTKNRGSGLGLFSIIRNNLVKEKISIINDFYYIELQIKKAR